MPTFTHIKHGALHRALGMPANQKIPMSRLQSLMHSSSPLMRKRANFAINARKWKKK